MHDGSRALLDEAFLQHLLDQGYYPIGPTVGTAPGGGILLRIEVGEPDDEGCWGGSGIVSITPRTARWAPPAPIDATRAGYEAGKIVEDDAPRKKQNDQTQQLDAELRACYPASGPLHAYMDWAHRVTHTPPQFHLASILPPMATECNRRGWEIDPGEPLHIWSSIVAGAAIGKTTAMSMSERFTKAWAKHARGVDHNETWVSLEGSLPGVYHALSAQFDEGTGRTIATLQHSELSRVLRSDDALEMLCMLFDTRDVQRNLRYLQKRADKGEGEEDESIIRSPRVSALVTTTHASLEDTFRSVMLRGGLASRMLWFTGAITAEQLMPRERVEPALYNEAQRAFWEWSGWLASLDSQYASEKRRKVITFTEAADDKITEFYDSLRAKIVDPHDPLASIYQRSTRMAMRIAGIYALSLGRTEIDIPDIDPALHLVTQSLSHVGALAPSMDESRLSRHRLRLVAEIKTGGAEGIRKTRAFKVLHGLSKFEIDNVLSDLVEMEEILDPGLTIVRGERGRPAQHLVAYSARNAEHWRLKSPRAMN